MSQVLSSDDLDRALTRMAHEIIEKNANRGLPVIVGIRTRGEHLARRLVSKIHEIGQQDKAKFDQDPPLGILDINLYRDDLTRVAEQPIVRETLMDFSIDDQIVVLVDDVLYTGRTVRCALDALADLGRPKAIQLSVMIDRGHRELPIKADYVGKNIPTSESDIIHVHLKEVDGDDCVVLESGQSHAND